MRFWNKSKGFRLVVKARQRTFDPLSGAAGRTTGLSATFNPVGQYGVFDSEQAQRIHGWSEDERRTVERALLEHVTFGQTMHLLDLPDEEAKVLGVARTCMFIRPAASGEIAYCGREIESDEPYCARCTSLLVRAEEMARDEVELVETPIGEAPVDEQVADDLPPSEEEVA